MLRKGGFVAAAFASVVMLSAAVQAQGQFPNKPIRLIVPQAPGSATDIIVVSARFSLAARDMRAIRASDTSSASSTTAITTVMATSV